MQLYHEELAETVTILRRDFRDRLDHERRVLPRFRVWTPLSIRIFHNDTAGAGAPFDDFTVWLRDLSRGGAGIMYTRPLAPGAKFAISLPRFNEPPRTILCSVVYCCGVGTQMYSVGARFEHEMLEAIIPSLSPSAQLQPAS